MTGADATALLILLTILIAIGVYLLHWLYRHSSKDQSFVRTGSGGERVVMGGGALVIPIIHDITLVNMNAIPVEVRRTGEQSLITRNKIRVDVVAEFFVRVVPSREGVSTAARTLGSRIQNSSELKEIVQSRFVDAMSAVAANLTMEEIHTGRTQFMEQVAAIVGPRLAPNGLELENASMTSLNQADISVFNPSNAFDAEGLLQLTEQIEERRKLRNRIENDTRVDIKQRDFEAEQRALEIDRDLEYARIEQQRAIEIRKAAQLAEIEQQRSESAISIQASKIRAEQESERIVIAKEKAVETERISFAKTIDLLAVERDKEVRIGNELAAAEQERAAINKRHTVEIERLKKEEEISAQQIQRNQKVKLAETAAHRQIEDARVAADREIDELRIAARKYIDRFEIEQQREIEIVDKERLIAVVNKSLEEALAKTQAAEAFKALTAMEEQIDSVRAEEIASRAKRVELIDAESRTEREAMRRVREARADKEASEYRAAATVAEAKAMEVRLAKEAEGTRLLNESENLRSESSRRSAIYEHLVRNLPNIIRETVKPMERIESIKILQVDGVPGLNSPSERGDGEAGPSGGNMTDRVVNSAMKYRTQVAFVDGLMKDLGLPIDNLGSAGGMSFRNFPAAPDKGKDDD